MDTSIEIVREVSDEIVDAFQRLLPQVSRSAATLDHAAVARVLSTNTVVVARVAGDIVGSLTIVMFAIPSGIRAWIEDVVVDERARGRGIGAAMVSEAVRIARAGGARTIDLTSNPSRAAANRLYERLGFVVRDTRVYRLSPDSPRER